MSRRDKLKKKLNTRNLSKKTDEKTINGLVNLIKDFHNPTVLSKYINLASQIALAYGQFYKHLNDSKKINDEAHLEVVLNSFSQFCTVVESYASLSPSVKLSASGTVLYGAFETGGIKLPKEHLLLQHIAIEVRVKLLPFLNSWLYKEKQSRGLDFMEKMTNSALQKPPLFLSEGVLQNYKYHFARATISRHCSTDKSRNFLKEIIKNPTSPKLYELCLAWLFHDLFEILRQDVSNKLILAELKELSPLLEKFKIPSKAVNSNLGKLYLLFANHYSKKNFLTAKNFFEKVLEQKTDADVATDFDLGIDADYNSSAAFRLAIIHLHGAREIIVPDIKLAESYIKRVKKSSQFYQDAIELLILTQYFLGKKISKLRLTNLKKI